MQYTWKLDDLHFSMNEILSRGKSFNYVVSAREAGKTTSWIFYAFACFLNGFPSIVVRRMINDISEKYITSLEDTLNKFVEPKISFLYKKGAIKDGVIDVHIKPEGEEQPRPFITIIALSNPKSRIKSLIVPNCSQMFTDEFIVDTRHKEKYLDDELGRFKELFNTFQRESPKPFKAFFFGNPYSLYNPYFSWHAIPTKQLYEGSIITGSNYCVQCYKLKPELKEYILKHNPLYTFDDSYTKYAFDGRAINDEQILIQETQPPNYQLKYVFYTHERYLGMFFNRSTDPPTNDKKWYWASVLNQDQISDKRKIICFDFNDLLEGNILLAPEDKKQFYFLKLCFRQRLITFKSIEESYLFEEIFNLI